MSNKSLEEIEQELIDRGLVSVWQTTTDFGVFTCWVNLSTRKLYLVKYINSLHFSISGAAFSKLEDVTFEEVI